MNEKRKVLIIDDEVDLAQLLKGYFNRNNFEVHIFHTLKDGIPAIKALNPDIVFIDNNFPDGNGWNIVPQLAKDHPKMNIVLISAFNAVFPPLATNELFHVIEKPIRHTDLDRFLEKVKL